MENYQNEITRHLESIEYWHHQAEAKEQECKELKEDYAELEQRHDEAFQDFKRITQEYENLKAEEKYLKQCCTKAGEELAKHSFEYDGKEKNLVVQALELNEKYEKLKKALEEIEEVWTKDESGDYDFVKWQILDIIDKAKGKRNE